MKNLTILISVFIFAYAVYAQQENDVWNKIITNGNSYVEENSHEIFKNISKPDGNYSSSKLLNIKLYLNRYYDSLFVKNPKDFKWIVSKLPKGAKFNSKLKSLRWKPTISQIGNYQFKFFIKYKDKIDSIQSNITISEEWTSSWVPGLSFVYYQPKNKSKYGTLMGPSIEYLIVSWIHRNENSGPSHGRVFIKLDLLSSDNDTISDSFGYSMGVNLSLERNAKRNWLIPFYGLEFGGFYNKITKNLFYIAPLAGVWLYTSQNLFISAEIKYQLPTYEFENLNGLKANIGFNMSLW